MVPKLAAKQCKNIISRKVLIQNFNSTFGFQVFPDKALKLILHNMKRLTNACPNTIKIPDKSQCQVNYDQQKHALDTSNKD